LANLTLDGLQKLLAQHFPAKTVKGKKCNPRVNMVRYADDFIITGKTKEILENEVKPLVEKFLKQRGLELSREKTKITHIDDGFDFLAQNLRRYKGKLIVKPSGQSVKTFLDNIRTIIKANKTIPQAKLIKMLNPKILGWANYHKHVVSTETFDAVKNEIWKALWQWARRRHSEKRLTWIKAKYFKSRWGNQWIFGCETDDENYRTSKQKPLLQIIYPTKLQVVRHRKIVGEANPFDPQWDIYFEERQFRKIYNHLKGRGKLLSLWNEQKGYCPICYQRITQQSGWHVHHILERSKGGDNTQANLVMLHPNCHRQIHAQKKMDSCETGFHRRLKEA
jgi:RNA-directed DNA polymerase